MSFSTVGASRAALLLSECAKIVLPHIEAVAMRLATQVSR
jgi:hypothetical protein